MGGGGKNCSLRSAVGKIQRPIFVAAGRFGPLGASAAAMPRLQGKGKSPPKGGIHNHGQGAYPIEASSFSETEGKNLGGKRGENHKGLAEEIAGAEGRGGGY